MSIHPFCQAWKAIMESAGIRPIDLCQAAGISRGNFSRYMHGKMWPTRRTVKKINRGFECLLGRPDGAVDNLVERVLMTGGKVGAKLFDDVGPQLSPQLIPVIHKVIHKPKQSKTAVMQGSA